MTIFRVAEYVSDCVRCGKEKQSSRQPQKSFLENEARPKSRKMSDNFPDALPSRCVCGHYQGRVFLYQSLARHLFLL